MPYTACPSFKETGKSLSIMGFDLAVVGGDGSAVAAQLCTAAVNSLGRNESSVSVLVLCDARLVDENAAKSMLQSTYWRDQLIVKCSAGTNAKKKKKKKKKNQL